MASASPAARRSGRAITERVSLSYACAVDTSCECNFRMRAINQTAPQCIECSGGGGHRVGEMKFASTSVIIIFLLPSFLPSCRPITIHTAACRVPKWLHELIGLRGRTLAFVRCRYLPSIRRLEAKLYPLFYLAACPLDRARPSPPPFLPRPLAASLFRYSESLSVGGWAARLFCGLTLKKRNSLNCPSSRAQPCFGRRVL